MKTVFLKAIGGAGLAILTLAVFGQVRVSAQDISTEQKIAAQTFEDSAARRSDARAIEGVWDITVTRRNCQTGTAILTAVAMITYARGGTMLDWGTGMAPSLRSPGQGLWNHLSGRNFYSAFQFFRFNVDGTLAGRQIVRTQIELGYDGIYRNSATAQILDVNGNVIQNNCSTATATRFQ